MIRFGSVCSGIEAASVAWHPLGWQAAWVSEIEPFPAAVLAHHYPDVPNLGDMRALPAKVLAGEVEAPDLLCGGTPCQAFSVAGLRRSLSDDRGNLTLTFVELADAIDTVRLARGQDGAIIVWENVPGVLTTQDNAFGCFLAGLAGEDEPLAVSRWPRAGVVDGRRRRVAWCVLDAQYFGLAQRRRRVFVLAMPHQLVGRFGEGADPAAILLIGSSLRRDTPTRGEARKIAPTIPARSAGGGGLGTDFDLDGGLVPRLAGALDLECGGGKMTHQSIRNGHVIGTITARMFNALGARDVEEGALLAVDAYNQCLTGNVSKTLAARDDQDTASVIVQTPIACKTSAAGLTPTWIQCDCCDDWWCMVHNEHTADCDCPPLEEWAMDPYGLQVEGPAARSVLAFDTTQVTSPANRSQPKPGDPCHPLAAGAHAPAVAVSEPFTLEIRGRAGGRNLESRQDGLANALRTPSGGRDGMGIGAVANAMQVRRLTPRECERLQGFPDDYTAIPWRGKPAADCPDGPRYKALGNSWAVPVVRWIGQRISATLKATQ